MTERTPQARVESTVASSSTGLHEATGDDRLVCVRVNLKQMLSGHEHSKELIRGNLRQVEEGTACVSCTASDCDVDYELDIRDGSMRSIGDCAVIMSDILKPNRGMTYAEFILTPQGKKMHR